MFYFSKIFSLFLTANVLLYVVLGILLLVLKKYKYRRLFIVALFIFYVHLIFSFFMPSGVSFWQHAQAWFLVIPTVITGLITSISFLDNILVVLNFQSLFIYGWFFLLVLLTYFIFKKSKFLSPLPLLVILLILYFFFRFPYPPFSGEVLQERLPLFLSIYKPLNPDTFEVISVNQFVEDTDNNGLYDYLIFDINFNKKIPVNIIQDYERKITLEFSNCPQSNKDDNCISVPLNHSFKKYWDEITKNNQPDNAFSYIEFEKSDHNIIVKVSGKYINSQKLNGPYYFSDFGIDFSQYGRLQIETTLSYLGINDLQGIDLSFHQQSIELPEANYPNYSFDKFEEGYAVGVQ